jgi:hypothetical protein
MQLAPVQFLAPVVAVGFLSWSVGAAGGGRGWRSFGGFLLVTCAVIVGLYATFVGLGMAVEEDPALGGAIVVGVMLGLSLIGLLFTARRTPPGSSEKQQKDDDGGGGQRRPKPDLPRTPPPAPPAPAPTGPSAPWEQFDDLRKQWERVPVGTR